MTLRRRRLEVRIYVGASWYPGQLVLFMAVSRISTVKSVGDISFNSMRMVMLADHIEIEIPNIGMVMATSTALIV